MNGVKVLASVNWVEPPLKKEISVLCCIASKIKRNVLVTRAARLVESIYDHRGSRGKVASIKIDVQTVRLVLSGVAVERHVVCESDVIF